MTRRVSALIVAYNHGRYIGEAIASALAQTEPPDEVVVVDDGSGDDTIERARAVADSRVRIVALPHRGLPALADTYGRGLAECSGDLVAILEGDDRWPPEKLARQQRAFARDDVVLSHGPYSVIGARGALLKERVTPVIRLAGGAYDALPLLLRASYIMPVTAVVRRTALVAAGGFRQLGTTPHFDHPTFLGLAERGLFDYEPSVVGIWRRHGRAGTYQIAGRYFEGTDLGRENALEVVRRLARPNLPTEDEIRRAWDDAHGHMAWQASRILLREGRHAEAGSILRSAIGRRCSLHLRARLLLAATAAALHVSIEPLARLVSGHSVFEELD